MSEEGSAPVGDAAPAGDAPMLSVNAGGMPNPDVGHQVSDTPAPVDAAPTSLIDSDGNFTEGWHKSIAEGAYADNGTLSNFKTLEGLAKTLINQQSMIGADKLVKPTQHSSPEEWAAFYQAGGTPETVEGYKIEGMAIENDEGYNYDGEQAMLQWAHDNNLSNAQTEALINRNRQGFVDSDVAAGEAHETSLADAKSALVAKWGTEFDANLNLANEMMSNPAIESLVQDLGAANNPKMVELLCELRRNTREDAIPDNSVGNTHIGAQQELAGLMQEQSRLINSQDPADQMRVSQISARTLQLREQLNGSQQAGKGYQSSSMFG